MAFRKYKFGPAIDGGEEFSFPSVPIAEPTIIEQEEKNIIPDIGNTIDTNTPELVRVIDNTDSLSGDNKNNINTENEALEEKEEEIKQQEELPTENMEQIPVDNKEEELPEVKEEETKKPILKKVEEKVTQATGWKPDENVSLGVFSFKNKSERTVFLAFIIPPLVISIISMIHVVSFFELSNTSWLSWALAAAFEFASISALFALTALTKIKKNTIWILFFAIVVMQVIGNMYHSYIHMDPTNPDLLKLLSIIGVDADALPWTLRILGFLQGGVLPVVALTFVKAIVEYLSVNREEKE